jgi:hypothetical protein
MCRGKDCQLLGRGEQSNQREMAVTMLSDIKRITAICDVELQTVQEMQFLKKSFNWAENSCS